MNNTLATTKTVCVTSFLVDSFFLGLSSTPFGLSTQKGKPMSYRPKCPSTLSSTISKSNSTPSRYEVNINLVCANFINQKSEVLLLCSTSEFCLLLIGYSISR